MSHSIIASQLDAPANQYLRDRLPDHEVIDIAPGQLQLDVPADVFIVRPINVRGNRVDNPPAGWPGSLRWVQVVSSGIDFYPTGCFRARRSPVAAAPMPSRWPNSPWPWCLPRPSSCRACGSRTPTGA